ncbi:MAG: 3-hydroxyacyl-[acyl-carrier-protein] dehydratase FabZ [Elusimicrobia bacterium RIFCSPLOWO2_01_FULL_59_12]|nr:MAG: 3-hydroxyacyl-[acyl-carrier-protein] dehydratase FabZ [Elusimicrobia bacterium RIFCSPLOWO2_01_FULL_59_12]
MPPTVLDYDALKKTIPHRYPFLLIDRVTITDPEKSAVGIKNVSGNEPFFQGHFPERAVMPGVLIVESLAQVACALFLSRPAFKDKLAFFMGMEEIKFRKPVVPGDRLELKIEILKMRDRFGKAKGEALVDGQLVTEAVFSFAVVDKDPQP